MESVGNKWADWWRNKVGVNVVPNDSVNKKPMVEWGRWHSEPIPKELHEEWKAKGMFDKGIAVCVGPAWHLNNNNNGNNKLFFVAIDCDNLGAVNFAMANLPIASMAQESRGVQEKMHLYVYVTEQMENYTPPDDAPIRIELHAQKHLITCTPSQYGLKQVKDGKEVCIPTGKYYKMLVSKIGTVEAKLLVMPAVSKKKRKPTDGLPFDEIREGGRNNGFFSVCVSFMKKFKVNEKFDKDLAWLYLWNYNLKYCKPPLAESEAKMAFESSLSYKDPNTLEADQSRIE